MTSPLLSNMKVARKMDKKASYGETPYVRAFSPLEKFYTKFISKSRDDMNGDLWFINM